MKRTMVFGAVAGTLLAGVAACGGTPTPDSTPSASPASLSGSLVFWDTSDAKTEAPVMRGLVDAFGKENPKVKVTYTNVPPTQFPTAFTKAVKAGKTPDVVRVSTAVTAWLGSLTWLKSLSGTTVDRPDEFFSAAWNSARIGNVLVSVPQSGEPVVMVSSTSVLGKAGLQVPGTWDELQAGTAAMKAQGAVPMLGPGDGLTLLPFVYSYGGGMIDTATRTVLIDDAGSVNGFSRAKALVEAGTLTAPAALSKPLTGRAALRQGKVATLLTVPSEVRALMSGAPFQGGSGLNVSGPPAGPGDLRGTAYTGFNLAVVKKTKNESAAVALAAALTSATAQATLAGEAGQVPTRPAVYAEDPVAGNPILSGYRAVMETAAPAPMVENAAKLYSPISTEWRNMLAGQTSAKDGAAAIAVVWSALLPSGYSSPSG